MILWLCMWLSEYNGNEIALCCFRTLSIFYGNCYAAALTAAWKVVFNVREEEEDMEPHTHTHMLISYMCERE